MKAVSVAGESPDTSKSAQGSTVDAADTPTPEPAPPEATPAAEPTDPRPAADPAPVPVPAPAAEAGEGSEPEPDSGAAPVGEAAAEAEADSRPAPDPRSAPADGPGTDPALGSVLVTEPVAAARKGSAPEADTGPRAEAEPEPDADPVAESEVGPDADADADTAEGAPVSEASAERPSGTSVPEVKEAKEAKETKEASSTAGPAPDTAPAPASEAGSPTPSGRKAVPESDNERTSTFVALKPLDPDTAPAEAAAAPSAPPTPTWAKRPATAPAPAPAPADAKPDGTTPAGATGWPRVPARSEAPRPAATTAPPRPAPEAPAPERSQPLPPLDLLAQLTNTPPPPETAARTVGRRFKIWTPVLLALLGAGVVAQTVRPLPAPTVTTGDAPASFTFDGTYTAPWPGAGQGAVRVVGSGDVGTFGEQKPVPIASVAKVMTAYVILKGHPLKKDEAGPLIEIDAKMVADGTSEDESRVEGLTAGSKFSQQDVLKMLMVPSGNNAARLLARWDGGSDSEAAFVEKMNAAAKELGMTNTTYTDPSGLDAGTKSTAEDQLKLAEAVMRFDAFRPIVMLPSAPIKGLATPLINNNGNLLLAGLSITGIKTGSSSAAGGALMWAAYKSVGGKDQLIIGTTLEQRAPAPDKDAINSLALVKENSKKIIESVRGALTAAGAVKKGQVVGYVDDGLGKRTPLVATRDGQAVGVPGQQVRLALADGGKALPHAAKAGTPVGELVIGDGPGAAKVPLALKEDLAEPSFGAKLLRFG
ncbi:serine hydrolase [Streptomyces sp. NBC_00536]|uniref:D-alanyl-D-alanine carboxypeptidase family protein n=1 Tax=Streptomyces sp. NBC_00536 TaxID=2975769 RepID=UPI002E7FC126|nr:serine hydrolase [Streptomyces sp. NBC_00536]WUC77208.1 serine hydrolase [Streptomyces sp. NBC_00536]